MPKSGPGGPPPALRAGKRGGFAPGHGVAVASPTGGAAPGPHPLTRRVGGTSSLPFRSRVHSLLPSRGFLLQGFPRPAASALACGQRPCKSAPGRHRSCTRLRKGRELEDLPWAEGPSPLPGAARPLPLPLGAVRPLPLPLGAVRPLPLPLGAVRPLPLPLPLFLWFPAFPPVSGDSREHSCLSQKIPRRETSLSLCNFACLQPMPCAMALP